MFEAFRDPRRIQPGPLGSAAVVIARFMSSGPVIAGRRFFVRSADRFRDGINEFVSSPEVGSCSLQEEEVLGHSVEALIGRGDGDRQSLAQLPCPRFTTP